VCEEQWQPGFHGPGCWAQFVRVSQVLLVLHVLARVVLRPIAIVYYMMIAIVMSWGLLWWFDVGVFACDHVDDVDDMQLFS
jgi:hypothetical protein